MFFRIFSKIKIGRCIKGEIIHKSSLLLPGIIKYEDCSSPPLPSHHPARWKPALPEDAYPNKSPKEREYEAAKEHGAVFLMNIGEKLASGEPHNFYRSAVLLANIEVYWTLNTGMQNIRDVIPFPRTVNNCEL